MNGMISLSKRNIKMYLRDYVSVFFSVLSMLIVLALMVIFLGKMNCENVVDALAQFGGVRDTAVDEKNAAYLIQMWTLAGILEVNAVTITLTVMGTMVQDEAKGRLASFYLTPVRKIQIALGYITASWLVGTVMCTLTLVVGELYMAVCGHPLLDVRAQHIGLCFAFVSAGIVYPQRERVEQYLYNHWHAGRIRGGYLSADVDAAGRGQQCAEMSAGTAWGGDDAQDLHCGRGCKNV